MQSKPLLLGAVRWTSWSTDCLAGYGSETSRPVSSNRETIVLRGLRRGVQPENPPRDMPRDSHSESLDRYHVAAVGGPYALPAIPWGCAPAPPVAGRTDLPCREIPGMPFSVCLREAVREVAQVRDPPPLCENSSVLQEGQSDPPEIDLSS